jgi:hypothetical protein
VAGTYNHFLPRFLQKGFAVNGRVHVYRSDRQPFATGPAGVGAENDFNIEGHDTAADDELTRQEREMFVGLVDRLRERWKIGAEVHEPDLPRFLWSLESRTRNFRRAGEMAVGKLKTRLEPLLEDPRILAEAASRVGVRAELLEEMLQDPRLRAQIDQARGAFLLSIEPGVRVGHNRALAGGIVDGPRLARYQALRYFLVNPSPFEIPLPDSGVFFVVGGSAVPQLVNSPPPDRAYLPLGPRRLVVGATGDDFRLDFEVLARQAAECSSEFFVASTRSAALEQLVPSIGVRANTWLSDAEADRIAADHWKDHASRRGENEL